MKRLVLLATVLLSLVGFSVAQTVDEVAARTYLVTVAGIIQTELENHGELVMGDDSYHSRTRLEKMDNCRAELSIRRAYKISASTVRIETTSLSLGALDPYGIKMQKHWLQLPCTDKEDCILSSFCSQNSADGTVTDCTTRDRKRVSAFSMEFDGNADSAQRLEQAFRQAAFTCRHPASATMLEVVGRWK
jgi:hypothetical protein